MVVGFSYPKQSDPIRGGSALRSGPADLHGIRQIPCPRSSGNGVDSRSAAHRDGVACRYGQEVVLNEVSRLVQTGDGAESQKL